MKNEKETPVSIIIQIIIAIFAIILIIQLLLKFLGYSPTETQIMYAVITIIVGYAIGASYKLVYRLGDINRHLQNIDNTLHSINARFEKIDSRFERMEERLLHIERKIT